MFVGVLVFPKYNVPLEAAQCLGRTEKPMLSAVSPRRRGNCCFCIIPLFTVLSYTSLRGCPASLGVSWCYQLQGAIGIIAYLAFIECFSFPNALQTAVPLLLTSGMQIKVIGSIKQWRKKEGDVEVYLILNIMCTI